MSMIHGIVRFDGRQPGPEELRPMLEASSNACPDGAETWHGGCAALGLGLLRTLPHARTAPGPVHDPESGLTIVADARIDNRMELWNRLGLRDGAKSNDTELILHAYRNWGENCVEHLVGDFAFAVWNATQRTVYCARDHFGVKPLYYARTPGGFVFSSHLPSLLARDEVPPELDEACIADMLAGLPLAHNQTLYRGISQLPPSHSLTFGERGMALRVYWRPHIGEPVRYARDEEYVEAYRELLEQAVACRLETDNVASGLLSGGLDSGAITAIAANMLADRGQTYGTYSFVCAPGQAAFEHDEMELIELAHRLHGVNGHFVTTQDFHGSAAELFNTTRKYGLLGASSPHLAALFRKLHETGSRVLLDGYGGDQCATGSHSIPLQEFISGPQPMRLAQYLSASARFRGCSKTRVLLGMLRGLFPRSGPMDMDEFIFKRSLLTQEFIERTGLRERAKQNPLFRPVRHRSLGESMLHLLQSNQGLQHHPLFSENRVERRYPFFDKRLVEFCLAVPAEQHSYDMNRRLIRRAMHGLLPDAIRLRNNKGVNNKPGAISFLYENRECYIAAIDAARNDAAIAARIDLERLRKRFATTLPAIYDGRAKPISFMPGPTTRAFHMLLFLQKHATPNPDAAPPAP